MKIIPSGLAHQLGPLGLTLYADFYGEEISQWRPLTWRGLTFPNPMGIAGGLDKNADLLSVWPKIGVGFIEVGTITPRPQKANPGKIMDRDWSQKSLWNKMGFPNEGAQEVRFALATHPRQLPLFINIGRNRDTQNSEALSDYAKCVSILQEQADAFVVNVSSPNTNGLRELQNREDLLKLVSGLVAQTAKPILLKLSPDMQDADLQQVVEGSLLGGCSGFILTNTTLSRNEKLHFPKEGGVSGQAVAELSKATLQKVIGMLGEKRKDLLLVSAGGILTVDDVFERLHLGADLVQTYSGLVFNGPGFFHQVAKAAKDRP